MGAILHQVEHLAHPDLVWHRVPARLEFLRRLGKQHLALVAGESQRVDAVMIFQRVETPDAGLRLRHRVPRHQPVMVGQAVKILADHA